jgi:hypothetical protein
MLSNFLAFSLTSIVYIYTAHALFEFRLRVLWNADVMNTKVASSRIKMTCHTFRTDPTECVEMYLSYEGYCYCGCEKLFSLMKVVVYCGCEKLFSLMKVVFLLWL